MKQSRILEKDKKQRKLKRKQNISKSLRNAVWLQRVGKRFEVPCLCCFTQNITVFSYHVGHIRAESKKGCTELSNLMPICACCNQSMGTRDLREYQSSCGYYQPFLFWLFH